MGSKGQHHMKRTLIQSLLLFVLTGPVWAQPVSIEETLEACRAAGFQPAGKPVQSDLKRETSLIGLAYLNYIYQNDLKNPHFCESMLLMAAQVPPGTPNVYVQLFEKGMGERTLPLLQEIQLAFDYSIGRSQPPEEKVRAAIQKLQTVLKR